MTSVEEKTVMFAFQGKTVTSNATYSASLLDCSPASDGVEDQLDFLTDSNPLEQETLFLSGLDTSGAPVSANGDEFCCLMEWGSPLDPVLSSWNPRNLAEKEVWDVAISHDSKPGNAIVGSNNNQSVMKEEKGMYEVPKTNFTSPAAPVRAETLSGKRIWSGDRCRTRKFNPKTRLFKPSDSSENSEDEFPPDSRAVSKNLVSERRRRKKLNERLYSLRALVPKISKMDKASIVSDAISYVQELQQQVEAIQTDIQVLQANRDDPQQLLYFSTVDNGMSKMRKKSIPAEHRILELEVAQMEEQTYHLRIHCKKGPGVLVQLTKALEALDFEIISANLTSVNDHILNNVVIKARTGEILTPEELKKLTLEIVPRFGLLF